ncbi:MAG: hypothetical protein E6G40_03085 [Actinobacteria bacterium]|nr:MAG: hypothetical protein E6G40_03085 [Actinomycetota bacterium]
MALDEALLESHRGFRDDRSGIREEFLQPTLGPGRTVAVLSRPQGPSLPAGWVICHSFGLEQLMLHRLEVVVARALAAAGFPTLRFFVQGYGDSETRGQAVEVSWHLDGTMDAIALMRDMGGVSVVGALGVRFGALVAALAAERARLPLLGLWQPFLTGDQFLRNFAQTALFETMLEQADRQGSQRLGGLEEFGPEGWKDLNGLRLSRRALDDISAIDLRRDLRLLEAEVAAHLVAIGVDCREEGVQDESAPMLGQHQFRKIGDGEAERDIFYDAYRAIAEATVSWAVEHSGPAASLRDRSR